ncbi:MAG: type I glutamate--ammonia ligase [Myxococcales bacterium]|nr:type I glutamate--ammonia ligase [Myxococcales bacterium]
MTEIKTPKDAIAFAKANGAVMVDLRFTDLLGVWQHTSVPVHRLDEGAFEDGFGFDGSSIRGYAPINASDMLLMPDPATAKLDPFLKHPTVVFSCDIVDPITREPYGRDPRYVATKLEKYIKSTGIADTAYIGPEAEFFIFDDVRFASQPNESFYFVDSVEAAWNTGTDTAPNLGHQIAHKGGYFPVMPQDTLMDIRTEIVEALHGIGAEVEVSHHEVATAGQCEIDVAFQSLRDMADLVLWFKYIVKNTAHRHGKTATFMPKPMYKDNGSGMHCHSSLWKNGKPLFAGNQYAGLSEMAMHYMGGIIKHASAVCAITNPTVNSYRRLVPGFEAPVNLAYSSRNRSAALRIPTYSNSPKAKRVETRFPDPAGNPYLQFAALVMAGLDGIQNKIDPGDPLDKDIYSLSPEELQGVPSVPGTLEEALNALERDHEFLLKGDVFTKDIVNEWLSIKREHEVDVVRQRPTPIEYELYYNV